MNNDLENKLKILKIGYLEKLKTLVIELTDLFENFAKLNLDELYSKVHTVSGTSGMYGLKNLSDVSTEFEIYLKQLKNESIEFREEELKEKLQEYTKNIERVTSEG